MIDGEGVPFFLSALLPGCPHQALQQPGSLFHHFVYPACLGHLSAASAKEKQNIMECKTLNQTFEESEDLINLSFPNITITDFQAQKRPSPALFGWGQQKLCSQLELKWLLNRESQSLI